MQMIEDSIKAFTDRDNELARSVIVVDEKVNKLFEIVRDELIALIMQDSKNGEQAFNLMMIAKYFERIVDHAKNIAEWVIFSSTGIHENERTVHK